MQPAPSLALGSVSLIPITAPSSSHGDRDANDEEEIPMNGHLTAVSHIDITQKLVRLYIFLAQSLDRALDPTAGASLPEHELQSHLASARSDLMAMLAVNRVVKEKVEAECNRVRSLVGACLKGGASKTAAFDELQSERDALKTKTAALSDLLAVFRAV
jgi:hypothetical protein